MVELDFDIECCNISDMPINAPGDSRGWGESLSDFSIDETMRFDTHSTYGEHAGRSSGAWSDFLSGMEEHGQKLPSRIKDPWHHYFYGYGRFSSAYIPESSKPMSVGIAISSTDDQGLVVDVLYAPESTTETVSAMSEILTRNIFGEFSGLYGTYCPPRKYLCLPAPCINDHNFGLQRAFYDFAIRDDASGDIFVPFPGAVTPSREFNSNDLERFKDARPKDFTGVARYSTDSAPNISCEEFYRDGEYLGKIEIEYPQHPQREDIKYSGFDAQGSPIDLGLKGIHLAHNDRTSIQVRFLKLLAEKSPELREKILPRKPGKRLQSVDRFRRK